MLGITVHRAGPLAGFPGLGEVDNRDTNDCYYVNSDPAQPGGYNASLPWNNQVNRDAQVNELAIMAKWVELLPQCTGQDCSCEAGTGYCGLPEIINNWYMPAGAVQLPYGVWFTLEDFKGLDVKASNAELRKTIPGASLSAAVKNKLLGVARLASRDLLLKAAGDQNGSVQNFLDKNPDFALTYKGVVFAPYPKRDEMTGPAGLRTFIEAGGGLPNTKVLDGEVHLCQFPLRSCAAWCRGCVTKSWQKGIPTCAMPVAIDPERHWNFSVAFNQDGSFTIILRRQPDQTPWTQKYIGKPLFWLLDNTVGLIVRTVCKVHEQPETQAAAATAATAAPPPYAAAIVAVKVGLDALCPLLHAGQVVLPTIQVPEPPAPAPPPTAPTPPPMPPWYATTGGIAGLAVGGGLAAGILAVAIKRSRSH